MQALSLLTARLPLRWGDEKHLVGSALSIDAQEPQPRWQSLIQEYFHFQTRLSVGFSLYPNDAGYEEGRRILVRAVSLLLEQAQEAVLLFNGEYVVLQKLGQQVVLNAEYQWWSDEIGLEGELHLSHEKRPLPQSLL